jgi:NO-binding membrane sensor protein with MHYT domain
MYPHTLAGLGACFLAGVPFYRNDLVATSIVLAVALGAPALARRMRPIRPASVQVDA